VKNMSRSLIFLGGFSWAASAFLILLGIFYLRLVDSTVIGDKYEILIGWLGANILGGVIAAREFTSGSSSYSGGSDEGDSLISAVLGFSLSFLVSLIVWFYLSKTPNLVLAVGITSSLLAFAGLAFVGKFWESSPGY